MITDCTAQGIYVCVYIHTHTHICRLRFYSCSFKISYYFSISIQWHYTLVKAHTRCFLLEVAMQGTKVKCVTTKAMNSSTPANKLNTFLALGQIGVYFEPRFEQFL